MDLNEKIKLILEQKNISPSIFADEIGVQRSSISHILAGRNKPSLDIVQKIIKRFPELGVNWILDGGDLPTLIAGVTTFKPDVKHRELTKKVQVETLSELHGEKNPGIPIVRKNLEAPKTPVVAEKSVEKILIFYSDGTFQEFKPGL